MIAQNIIVIQGHLTATDKKAIKAMLALGMSSGKVGRKTYSISEDNGLYSVSYQIKDRGLVPVAGAKFRISTYRATFKMK